MSFIPLKLFPAKTNIDFIGLRFVTFFVSMFFIIATIVLLATRGLNFGIDFTGGILIEAKFEQTVELPRMRDLLQKAELGEISLQTFGGENNILIRLGQSSTDEGERAIAVNKVKSILAENFSGGIDYRKVDYVGPKVGDELIKDGGIALLLTFGAIMLYIWVRFEWQFGVGAILALVHDTVATLGFFSITQLEFNLTSIAALLTIIGYSINDSVVIFDRIRENFRKFKKMPLPEIINLSTNETMSRTIMTASTTLVALVALVLVGGDVIRSFSLAALFGIAIGTYSSIYVASPVLIYMKLRDDKAA
jgi:preprotein translocase subunit SecF